MVEHHSRKLVVVFITSEGRDGSDNFEVKAEENDTTARTRQ
jgi:hypothetical protein